jgi:hypothetical protein
VDESFEEEGKLEGGEGVPMQGASVSVYGGGGAVCGDVIGGGDTVELFASVDKGGGHAEMAHVFQHDAVVGGIEGALDVLVMEYGVLHHHICCDDAGIRHVGRSRCRGFRRILSVHLG